MIGPSGLFGMRRGLVSLLSDLSLTLSALRTRPWGARQLDVSQEATARRTGGRLFFMHASISARFPTVASNWYEKWRAVLSDDTDGIDKVIRALSPRQSDDRTRVQGSQARAFSQAQSPHALCGPKTNGCGSGVVEAADKGLAHAPVPAEGRGRNLRKAGKHDPVVPQASVDESGQALEGKGGGHGPRGGNGAGGNGGFQICSAATSCG